MLHLGGNKMSVMARELVRDKVDQINQDSVVYIIPGIDFLL